MTCVAEKFLSFSEVSQHMHYSMPSNLPGKYSACYGFWMGVMRNNQHAVNSWLPLLWAVPGSGMLFVGLTLENTYKIKIADVRA